LAAGACTLLYSDDMPDSPHLAPASHHDNQTPPLSDTTRQAATTLDSARHDATRSFSLNLDEVAAQFEREGLPRSMRTLQRYCASGRLDCLKTDTIAGEQYFVDPHSVERAITELKQLSALTHRALVAPDTSRHDATQRVTPQHLAEETTPATVYDTPRHDTTHHDMSPPVAYDVQLESTRDTLRQSPPAPTMPRQDATPDSFMTRYVDRIESENVFLREQVDRKDHQIEALLERDKETNFLVRGLQQMLTPLLGNGSQQPDRDAPFGRMR
jgi:hypothetical protein